LLQKTRGPKDVDKKDALLHQIAVLLTSPSEQALVLMRRYRYTTAVNRDADSPGAALRCVQSLAAVYLILF
jgi:hypothetical protein